MAKWKVDKTMAAWGIAFGILAIMSGVILLGAAQEGFFAEGFFLIVLSWIVFPILIALMISKFRRRRAGPK